MKKTFPRQPDSKIQSRESLRRILSKTKSRKNVVFTNGCFDLLHKGHITYLQKARLLGDILVVALNSDVSVKKLKGPGRPLNPLKDRMSVVAALESVDFVTWFGEDTPLKLIQHIHPDILVKGGDWKTDNIVGGREVIGWGGKVLSLPYVDGHSTTKLINKAKK